MKAAPILLAALLLAAAHSCAHAQLMTGVSSPIANLMGTNNFSAWSVSSTAWTGNTTTSPDSNTDAGTFADNTAAANHQITAPVLTVPSGARVTTTVFAKTNGQRFLSLVMFNGASSYGADFDLSTCGVGGTSQAANGTLNADSGISLPNGWCYVQISGSIVGVTSYTLEICNSNAAASVCPSYTGTSGSNFLYAARSSLGTN